MKRNFPDFIEAYMEFTQTQESSEKIHRWVAISIIAAALERKVWIPRGHYTLYPNLYVFIIGQSGLVKKSTSTAIGVNMLRELDKMRIMSERVTSASLIEQLKNSGQEFIYQGESQRQSAPFCYASELSVFLGEVHGSISELLTTFFDCQPNNWRKPWVYETKTSGITKVFGPCLNILGASTPTWLVKCIPASEMEGGFSSRVIFVVENDPPKRFIAWPEVPENAEIVKEKLIEDLATIHNLVGPMSITDEAKMYFSKWYEKHQKGLAEKTDIRFSGYYGRKPDTVLKVAMSLTISKGNVLMITLETLKRAIGLLSSLEKSMFDAFGAVGRNELSVQLHIVWDIIRKTRVISHALLLRTVRRDLRERELIEIIETLRRMKVIDHFLTPERDLNYESLEEAPELVVPSLALEKQQAVSTEQLLDAD